MAKSAAGAGAASTNARLEKAAEQMESHAAQLYAKAGASRSKAKALMAQGKKQEAMLALKRAKALEKQAEVAASTHAAIEQQQEMLQSSALQREVASALSASIATTKKKTAGLLEKAESAVDGSAELRDVAEEINEVMGGLAKADDYDEEDLLEELELLAREPDDEEATAAAAAAAEEALPSAADAKAMVEPQAIVVGIDPSLVPIRAQGEARDQAKAAGGRFGRHAVSSDSKDGRWNQRVGTLRMEAGSLLFAWGESLCMGDNGPLIIHQFFTNRDKN